MSNNSSPTARRPGIVSFIGVIITVQGLLAAVAGVVFIAFRNSNAILEATNQTAAALPGAGIGELIVAVPLLTNVPVGAVKSDTRRFEGVADPLRWEPARRYR